MTSAVIDAKIVEHELAKLEIALEPLALMGWMKAALEPFFQERARTRFSREGDDVSGRWAALADSTVSFRTQGQVDYGVGPINHRTGALEEYITESSGGYYTTGGDALMVYPGNPPGGSNQTGSLLAKLTAAQQGLSDPYTPARPVIGANEKDFLYVLSTLERYVMGV